MLATATLLGLPARADGSTYDASDATRGNLGIIIWEAFEAEKVSKFQGIAVDGSTVVSATTTADTIEIGFGQGDHLIIGLTDASSSHEIPTALSARMTEVANAIVRDIWHRDVKGICANECYRSIAADRTIVGLAAATGIFFGPLGGVFVGLGAGMMMTNYIENVKLNCVRAGCGPVMRP